MAYTLQLPYEKYSYCLILMHFLTINTPDSFLIVESQ